MAKNNPGDYSRLNKYENRLFYTESESIPKVMIAQKELIMAQQTFHFANIVAIDRRTKTVLDEEGLSTTQYPFYLAFPRGVYSRVLRFSGNTLINAVNIWLECWVADGFTQAILERIRDVVFALQAPGP